MNQKPAESSSKNKKKGNTDEYKIIFNKIYCQQMKENYSLIKY